MKKLIIILFITFILPLFVNAYTSMDTANSIVKSLKTEPDKWVHDEYKLYYFKDPSVLKNINENQWDDNADCIIWIANEEYGIEVKAPVRVGLPKDAKAFIWKTYQKWANQYFAELFESPKKLSSEELMAEARAAAQLSRNEAEVEEFVQLTTSNVKAEKRPNDFFSYIPKWVLISLIIIATASVLGILSFILISKRRK